MEINQDMKIYQFMEGPVLNLGEIPVGKPVNINNPGKVKN